MSSSWVGRQILALVLLAVVLVGISSFIGLTGAVRLATRQAKVESDMVIASVRSELSRLTSETSATSVASVAGDPRLAQVLTDALGLARSVLHVAVLAPDGIVVAHSLQGHIGSLDPPSPPLPEVESFSGVLKALWELARTRRTYQVETSLTAAEQPFATVRVVIAGTFIWDAVVEAAARGLRTAMFLAVLTLIAGIVLARFAAVRFRALEEGIAALSEGRLEPLPESGAEEFDRLARGLNMLAARIAQPAVPAEAPASTDHAASLAGQSRAIARLGEVAAGVAHEIRNELQAINFDLAALRQMSSERPSGSPDHAARIADGLGRLDGSIRGFLKIAHVRPPTPRPLDINELMTEVRERFGSEAALAGVPIELELEPHLPTISADPEVLRHALSNLIRNSLQAMVGQEDGRIVLSTSRCDGTGSGELVKIVVRDNGPGIPESVRDRVFDLFFTTRADGSGVGLAVVRQSIEMHGGAVSIAADDGKGTAVSLEMPVRLI